MPRPATVVYCGASLDGFLARPDGAIDWMSDPEAPPSDEDFGWKEFIAGVDAMVMGRKTFEVVLGFGNWLYGSVQVFVLSQTLTELPAAYRDKAELTRLPPRELLDELGRRGYRRVYVDGGQTIQGCLREDLIDELVVTRLPVLIGQGLPLFGPLQRDLHWEHVATQVYPQEHGLVKSVYRRRRKVVQG